MPEYVASYTGGIDQDTTISKRDPSTYYTAKNIRVVLAEGLDSGWVSNIKGTKNLDIQTWFNNALTSKGFNNTSLSIIGSGEIRNKLVLFTINNTDSYIFTIELDNDSIINCTLIYTDLYSSDNSKLNLSVDYPIRGFESNYQSPDIQYIHWTDFRDEEISGVRIFNPLRYMNIAQSDLLTGTIGLPASTFDILPNCILPEPIIDSINTGGNLLTGIVQYAYQLYNLNGSETLFSPLSNLTHLTNASETLSNTIQYRGSDVETDTGKLINLTITPDLRFSNIKVYAIHYEDLNISPSIRLIQDSSTSTTMNIKDSGESLDTLTVEEFVQLRENFTAKDIKSKDNILFASNIKTKVFDFDYDARAYRFPRNLSSTTIKYANGTSTTVSTSNWSTIDIEHDCINDDNSNKIQDAVNDKLYIPGTSIPGGKGPNVSYEFISDTFIGDNNPSAKNISVNSPYTNYSDPTKIATRHHQTDEIYRYGIVGFNDKFEPSFPKWIGDIRIPNLTVYNVNGSDDVEFYPISIKFTVTGLPDEVKYYQIVKVKREEKDRTVLAEGMLSHTLEYESTTPHQYRPVAWPSADNVGVGYTPIRNVITFISPEVTFNKNIKFESDDYFGMYSKFNAPDATHKDVTGTTWITDIEFYFKYVDVSSYTPYSRSIDKSIIAKVPIGTSDISDIIDIDATYKYLNWIAVKDTIGANGGPSGTKLVAKLNNDIAATGMNYEDNYIALYKRIRNNQYGGNTYIARSSNTYIPASPISESSITSVSAYGDTYIGMFEYLHSIYREDVDNDRKLFGVLYFPVQTSINLDLRLGTTINNDNDDEYIRLIQEDAGVHVNGSEEYNQPNDLYSYNSVYSRESDIVTFTAKPLNYVEQSEYDCDTKYSNTKVSGEYINSWTKFLLNNKNTVDTKYGSINKLEFFRNQLVFIQDKAVGVWGVNAKELITTGQPGALSVGTGGILDRFDYIDTNTGTKHQFSVVNTTDFIYYFDYYNKSFVQFAGQGDNLISKLKGVNATFKSKYYNPTIDTNIIAVYDRIEEDIIWTVISGPGRPELTTITYNQLLQKFSTFLEMYPSLYLRLNNNILAYNNSELHLMNVGEYGKLFDDYKESEVGILASPMQGRTCGYNSIKYANEIFDGNVNLPELTLSKVYATTNYQTSVELLLDNTEEAVRRNRIWRTYIPRDINDDVMSDGYIKLYLNFLNKNNYKFRLGECLINFNPTIE